MHRCCSTNFVLRRVLRQTEHKWNHKDRAYVENRVAYRISSSSNRCFPLDKSALPFQDAEYNKNGHATCSRLIRLCQPVAGVQFQILVRVLLLFLARWASARFCIFKSFICAVFYGRQTKAGSAKTCNNCS